ncbi:hypothetical protein [Membranihabitans marinus]|uniref:hypothetical protein n=1 Tax=Membranihabitans marinus TaxID=1227546 RepID=UPI001F3E9F97|nr:hypothetical protein [Membranihabitans marinus]
MATISHGKTRASNRELHQPISRRPIGLWRKYVDYVDGQPTDRVYWLVKAIIVIPCVYMTLSLLLMHIMAVPILWFVALSMILFFTNITLHVAGLKSRYYIIAFHATTLLFILIPLLTFLLIKI